MRCFLTDACARPPEKIVPVLHVLLDNGADVNDGWGPSGGALYAAILGSQPLEIIDKMVQKGAIVSSRVLHLVVENERLDVLEILLQRGRAEKSVKPDELVEWAKNRGNKEVLSVVQNFALDRAAEMNRLKRKHKAKRW
jgi:hypothetical protein